MKKILLVSGALLAVAGSAHASQARLLALGMNETDNDGMYYIQDSRNIFLNPAFINNYSNELVLEWGSTGQNAGLKSTQLSPTTVNNNLSAPKAQGGFFKKYNDFVYGLYVGNESNTSSLIRAAASSAFAVMNGYDATQATDALKVQNSNSKMLQSSDNQLDFFLGSDNGLKWGANFLYSSSKDESRSGKDSAMAIRGGLIGTNWDAHLNLSLASKAEASDSISANLGSGTVTTTSSASLKGKFGVQTGGSYQLLSAGRIFGYVKHYSWEQTDKTSSAIINATANSIGGQAGTVKGDFTSYYVGWGKDIDVNNGDKIFTSVSLKQTNINLNFSNKSEVRHLIVPVIIGYEAKATEWLTLRGSVVQNIYGQKDNKNIDNYGSSTSTRVNKVASGLISQIYGGTGKSTIANSTAVNAGATLTFGNLAIDGLVGTTGTTGTASSKTGVLSLANLETSVGMTYKF